MSQAKTAKGLALDIGEGQQLHISVPQSVDTGKIVITLEHKTGRKARLRISSAEHVVLDLRGERLRVPQG